MCGIVAIIGKDQAYRYVLDGLKRLEYRGYDSSGLAFITNNNLYSIKALGKLNNLINEVENSDKNRLKSSKIAIGHTRWATHGKVEIENTHPIISNDNIAVVHNGIIENYTILKSKLQSKGYQFLSSTDTEVIPHMFDYYIKNGDTFFEAGKNVLEEIDGAFSFVAMSKNDNNEIFISRKISPLVIGIGNNYNIIASDVQSISNLIEKVIYLDDGDYALITNKNIIIYDINNKQIKRQSYSVLSDLGVVNKDGYRHFMEKEIFEQPSVLINTISSLIDSKNNINIELDHIGINFQKGITICAAGTSYYAALTGKYWIEKLSGLFVNVELASEYRYRNAATDLFSSMIVISQSGESIDTLMAMREAREKGLKTCAIVNVENSTIDRESDYSIFTKVGNEIGVASTKSFTSQLFVLLLLSLKLGKLRGKLSDEKYLKILEYIKLLPSTLSKILKLNKSIIDISQKIKNSKSVIFLGRGHLYPLALEAALKLKEVSYIHAEGFAAGEMKHGSIALLEEDLPVIMFVTSDGNEDKSISNFQEAVSRGANAILIADKNCIEKVPTSSYQIQIPSFSKEFNSIFSPIVMSIPAQLLSYHVARERGTDVDQPRNLAKSVTVE